MRWKSSARRGRASHATHARAVGCSLCSTAISSKDSTSPIAPSSPPGCSRSDDAFSAWRVALLELAPADTHLHEHLRSAQAEQSYDYYLQGRLHLARMMRRGLQASRGMFVRSLELDPGYGPAWAGLATAHACLYEWFDTGTVGLARAEHASRRALETAPRLAEAHAARGLARSFSRHYDEAVEEFEEAIRLNPYLFDAYYYFARTAFALGDMARAAEMFDLAAQLRPEDFQSPMLLATAARALGHDECGVRRSAYRHPPRRAGARPQSARWSRVVSRRRCAHRCRSDGARPGMVAALSRSSSRRHQCSGEHRVRARARRAEATKRWICWSACSRKAAASATGS